MKISCIIIFNMVTVLDLTIFNVVPVGILDMIFNMVTTTFCRQLYCWSMVYPAESRILSQWSLAWAKKNGFGLVYSEGSCRLVLGAPPKIFRCTPSGDHHGLDQYDQHDLDYYLQFEEKIVPLLAAHCQPPPPIFLRPKLTIIRATTFVLYLNLYFKLTIIRTKNFITIHTSSSLYWQLSEQ